MKRHIWVTGLLLCVWTQAAAQIVLEPGVQEINADLLRTLTLDRDDDAIFDERERLLGTNPQSADTDEDGFDDLFEDYYRAFGFDPLVRTFDRDQDGLSDTLERLLNTSLVSPDSDGDGWSDFDEVLNAAFGYDPTVPTADQDYDGLADSLEAELHTSPEKLDSDGDGASDFEEYEAGLDPARPQEGGFSELIGRTYSDAMAKAILALRKGGEFPSELADELPYPAVTRRLVERAELNAAAGLPTIKLSAALLQSSIWKGFLNPYHTYNSIVSQLQNIAEKFDGAPEARIVRLFRWSQATAEGRYVYALKISDSPHLNESEREVLFMGVHHARELITSSITLGLIRALTDQYAAGDAAIQSVVNSSEIWIIPVVNPDGYSMALSERQMGADVNWRKNRRKATEFQFRWGVDPNRNYGFEHITSFSLAYRAALGSYPKSANGLYSDGTLNPDSDQYPAVSPFTEVETSAVRGLVNNSFLTGSEVSGIRCSLSWHSYGGEVIYPMGHATVNGLNPSHRPRFDALSDAVAAATGYTNTRDTWPSLHYPVYGDSDDWLYKEKGIYALTVESYSSSERDGEGPQFFPETIAKRNTVVNNNIQGALALIGQCCNPCWFLALQAELVGKVFKLRFQTDAGARYVVEYASSLTQPEWRMLEMVQGTGEPALVSDDSPATQAMRFYRVRAE